MSNLLDRRHGRRRLAPRFAARFAARFASLALLAGALGAAQAAQAAQTIQTAPAHAAMTATSSGEVTLPLPLAGDAYRVAQQGYAAYARGDYGDAAAKAREAIRQRPDVVSLRLLLANSLAAGRHLDEASRTLTEAIARLGRDPALLERLRQIDAQRVTRHTNVANRARPPDPGALTGEALAVGQKAYQAYAKKDYAQAASEARKVVALRPDLLRLRLLLIDAEGAAGQDTEAWQADLDAVAHFGDKEDLRVRRVFIGNRLAPKASAAAFAAKKSGDLHEAARLAQQVVDYAPDQIDYRLQLIDALFAANDLAGVRAAATAAIANDDTEIMPFVLRGYVLAAGGDAAAADADFTRALANTDATARNQRVARVIIADVWIARGQPQRALDLLAPLKLLGDDTDPLITGRRFLARRRLAQAGASAGTQTPAQAQTQAQTQVPERPLDPAERPLIDCYSDQFGATCDVYAADAGFAAARDADAAATRGDKAGAVRFSREAVAAAPDDAQHRVDLINALTNAGAEADATRAARKAIDDGLLDAMPPLTAAYVAQRAGDNRIAAQRFKAADEAGALTPAASADAAYASLQAHRNAEAKAYFERAIDAATGHGPGAGGGDATTTTPQQLLDMRAAHADLTRNWGVDASLNYRGAGLNRSFATSPTPGVTNNWQSGVEVYWRPFGSLGDRLFEVYARGYENFGVKGAGGPSGGNTLQVSLGARVKPFTQIDAIFAFERVQPIGSAVSGDWLARAAYSGGFGTERRIDVPSWWTTQIYAEAGHYLVNDSTYATGSVEMGRTYRLDRLSPRLTVFPYAVVGADYDTTVDRSIPVGAGVGVSTRYWFRDSQYDAPRSFVDVSVQYRLRLAGDDRARGVFFSTVLSY